MRKPISSGSPPSSRQPAAETPALDAFAAVAKPGEDPTAALLFRRLGGEHRRASPEEALEFFCEGLAPGSLPCQVMTAAVAGDAGSLASLLKRGDVLPDFANARGLTPLMAAAVSGQSETAGLLAAHPLVSLGRQNPDGWTALHFAAWAGEAPCVSCLLLHRAPVRTKNQLEKTAFDLASPRTQAAFWENREFARQMKRPASGVSSTQNQEEPAPAEPDAPADPAGGELSTPAKKDTTVRSAFMEALSAAAAQLLTAPALSAKIADQLASLPPKEFAEIFRQVEADKISLDWTDVFIAAAARDNTQALWLLQDRFYYETSTLNSALDAALGGGDNRAAVHHLMVWGADPEASCAAGGTLRDRAFNRHLAGSLEEMVLWPSSPGKKKTLADFRNEASEAGLEDMDDALRLWEMRLEYKGQRAKTLSDVFNRAVENSDLLRTMAAYAEARQDRLLRGTVEFGKKAGGGAIAVALLRERYDFARMLIAGGFHLKDAEESHLRELRLLGSPRAKQFADDHLSGKLEFHSVADAARMAKSQQRIHTTGFHGGRYGMWG